MLRSPPLLLDVNRAVGGGSSIDISGIPSSRWSCANPRPPGPVRPAAVLPAGAQSDCRFKLRFLRERRNKSTATTMAKTPTAMPMDRPALLPPLASLPSLVAPVAVSGAVVVLALALALLAVVVAGLEVAGTTVAGDEEDEEELAALDDAEADAADEAEAEAEEAEADVDDDPDVTELMRLFTRSSVLTVDSSATVRMAACLAGFPAFAGL
ncbi:hypothetical protein BBJ28_00009424 [Nothophytophthora sp. Chile5]|nr:hypothetical protein BBJ28_00009424 [Nothophytophthora sp. Chile5]